MATPPQLLFTPDIEYVDGEDVDFRCELHDKNAKTRGGRLREWHSYINKILSKFNTFISSNWHSGLCFNGHKSIKFIIYHFKIY